MTLLMAWLETMLLMPVAVMTLFMGVLVMTRLIQERAQTFFQVMPEQTLSTTALHQQT